MHQHKAVVLGNNYYIGLSVMRCLGVHGIHTVAMDYSDDDCYAATSKYCSERHTVPHYQNEKEAFVDYLVQYAKRQDLKPVLVPCHDSYLEVIDEHLNMLKEYYLIPQTEQGLYQRVMDKETLHQLASEKGFKVPDSVSVDDKDLYTKVENIIKFPCLVKPTDSPAFVSKFRRKLFKVHNMDELNDALQKAKDANLEVIVQRIIPGFDSCMHTFDAYMNQDAKVTHWVTCQKLRQYPINFGASVYTVQRYFPELVEIGTRFFEAIKFKGFAEIEFKKDAETGEFYIIEINARTTNFNNLLYKVGMNFPYIMYRELTGNPVEPKGLEKTTNRAFRYGYEDTLAIRDYVKEGQLSVFHIAKSMFRKKAPAIFSVNDMKPAFSYSKLLSGKVIRRLKRK